MNTDRLLDFCDRALSRVTGAVVWFALVCGALLAAAQITMYADRLYLAGLERSAAAESVAQSPSHGGGKWQTK